MPLLWRYLLSQYFQVFLLSISGFIGVLLVTRFQDIASFATTGAGWGAVALFTLYQIPHVLPIAIPISGLIAALLLFQRLSHTQELTALRASGLGLKAVVFPLFISAIFLALLNFTVVSELGPICKGRAKRLGYEMAMANPLSLFQKDSPIRIKDAYVDIHQLEAGKHAEDITLVLKNLSNGRLGLMTAKELWLEGESLLGKEVTFISSLDPKRENAFDHLIIENQAAMSTRAANLAQLVESADLELHYDYLPLRFIIAKMLLHRYKSGYAIGKGEVEIARRLSLAIAAFTFTFMGVAFGMQISRNKSKKGLFSAILLAALFLGCFVSAKSLRQAQGTALFVYLAPHLIILFCAFTKARKIARGVE